MSFVRERVAPEGREGSEYDVVCRDFQHRNRHIISRFEGEFTVESEVPQNGKRERDEIRRPVYQV